MSETVQGVPSQSPSGPFAAIRAHFEKHGTIYLIILGAAGLFVAILVWQNNQGIDVAAPASTVDTSGSGNTANQADLNSILAGIEGQSTQLEQIQANLSTQPTGLRLQVTPGENAGTLASSLGIAPSVFQALPGVWSAFVSGGGRWSSAKQGGTISIPTTVLPEQTIQTALQPKTASGQ